MGVQLGDLVEKKEISLSDLNTREIAIDAFNSLYQFLSIIRQYDGTPLMDSQGRITSHLSGLFYRTANLLQNGVKPVFIFDGEHSLLKKSTIEKREEAKEKAKQKLEEAKRAGRVKELRKYAQATSRLSDDMIKDSKELLEAMGVPVVQAPGEGEAQAAFMAAEKEVWAAGSQDYDSLLFGAPRLVRNLAITGKRKLPNKNIYVVIKPELIELEETLAGLGITREQLIEIGLMIGTDFNQGIKGIGPKKALELVKQGKSYEDACKEKGMECEEVIREVRKIFLKPRITKDYSLEWKKPDEVRIMKVLVEEHDFSKDRVLKVVDALITSYEERETQQRIDKWF